MALPVDPDVDLLDRWLAILGLIERAESLAARRSGAWAGLAIVEADAAVEAMLGVLTLEAERPLRGKESFDDLLRIGEGVLGKPLPAALRGRVLNAHKQRNEALHLGTEPHWRVATTALGTARELSTLVARRSALLDALGGQGPVRAVAKLIEDVEAVAEPLTAAADAMDQRDALAAADQAAIALDRAISRLEPRLRPDPVAGMAGAVLSDAIRLVTAPPMYGASGGTVRVGDVIGPLQRHIALQEEWILTFAIGLRPHELTDLRRVFGTPSYYVGQTVIERDPGIELTLSDVESRLSELASVILRLVLNDEIRAREWWELREAPAQKATGVDPQSDPQDAG